MENINWYPGHMKKTRELIQENLKFVDAVIEVIDARIPESSRNPIINELTAQKTRIIILNKSDLADPASTMEWKKKLETQGTVLAINSNSGEGTKSLITLLAKMRDEKNSGKERKRPFRVMIVGIPNVGKSSLINRLTGAKSARTGNKPGVTRGKQWLNLGEDIDLLDTPGILWPKFEDPNVGENLAFCGSIKDEIMDLSTLGMDLIGKLCKIAPEKLKTRYKLDEILPDASGEYDTKEAALENMEAIAKKRGFILPGKRIDYERTARTVIDEFRSGTIGRITLE